VNRGLWAQRTLEDYRPLLERLAGSLGSTEALTADDDPDLGLGLGADDQLAAMLGPMIQAMQPMMVAMTAGSMVGHIARRALGSTTCRSPARRPTSFSCSCRTSRSSGAGGACRPTICACGSASTRSPTTPCSACPTCAPGSRAC